MNPQRMTGESPAVHVVPAPWDSPVDHLNDNDLIDVTNWDGKTLSYSTKITPKGPNDAIAFFENRKRKHHCIS
jgi:hypothetical protein